jgi:outer membrane immunogenic protein
MYRSLATAVLLASSAYAAVAADLPAARWPTVPTTLPSRVYNWAGFYLGANVGGGWANAKSDFSAGGVPFASASTNLSGVLGGAQLGGNWQTGSFVYGLETDFQFSAVDGRITAPNCPAAICGVAVSASYRRNMPWFGTVRGRVGYARDSWLLYATGGYAYAHIDSTATATVGALSASVNRSEMRSGWTLGGGVELGLTPNWSVKVEYLYLDFGSQNRLWRFTGLPAVTERSRVNENLVRAGVNYRF